MADYFTGSRGQCEAFVARCNVAMRYPTPDGMTQTYAIPREHASQPGTWFVIIKQVHSPAIRGPFMIQAILDLMTQNERNAIKTRETLEAEGAYPAIGV